MEDLRILRIEHAERIFAFGGERGEIHYLPRFAGYGIRHCMRGGAAPDGIADSIKDKHATRSLIHGGYIDGGGFLLLWGEADLVETNGAVVRIVMHAACHEKYGGQKYDVRGIFHSFIF